MSSSRSLLLATVTGVRDSKVCYPSCSECYGKLLRENAGDFAFNGHEDSWRCMRCHIDYDNDGVQYRYRLQLTISDGDSIGDVSIFGKTLEPFFGRTATGINRLMCSLREENEACIQDSETMLLKALHQTFVGHQFWFGVKPDQYSSYRMRQHSSKKTSPLRLCHILPKNNTGGNMSAANPRPASLVAFQLIYAWDRQFITVIDNLFTILTTCKLGSDEVVSEQSVNLQVPTYNVCRAETSSTSFNNGYSQLSLDAEVNKNLYTSQDSSSFASRKSSFGQQSVWLSCDRDESSSSSRENNNDDYDSTKSSGSLHLAVHQSDENPQGTAQETPHSHPGNMVPIKSSDSDRSTVLMEWLGDESSSNIEILRSEVDQVLGYCPGINNDETNPIYSKTEILLNSYNISAFSLRKQSISSSMCNKPDDLEPVNGIDCDGISTAAPSDGYYQLDYDSPTVTGNDISNCWDDQSLNDSSFLLACNQGNDDDGEKENNLKCNSSIQRTSPEGNSIHSDDKVQKCSDMTVSVMPDSEDIDEFLAHITLPLDDKQNTELSNNNISEFIPLGLHCSNVEMKLLDAPDPAQEKAQRSYSIAGTVPKQQLCIQNPTANTNTANTYLCSDEAPSSSSASSSWSTLNSGKSDVLDSLPSALNCEISNLACPTPDTAEFHDAHILDAIEVNQNPHTSIRTDSVKDCTDMSIDLSKHSVCLHRKPSMNDCLDQVSVSSVNVPGDHSSSVEISRPNIAGNPHINITDIKSALEPAKRCVANCGSHLSNYLPDSEKLLNIEEFPDSEGLDSFLAKVSLPNVNEVMQENPRDQLGVCQNQVYHPNLSVETAPSCNGIDTIRINNDVTASGGTRPCADTDSIDAIALSDSCTTDYNVDCLKTRADNSSHSSSVQAYPSDSSLCGHTDPVNSPLSVSGEVVLTDSGQSVSQDIIHTSDFSGDLFDSSDSSEADPLSPYKNCNGVERGDSHNMFILKAIVSDSSPISSSLDLSNENVVLVASTPLPKQSRDYSSRVTQNNDAEEIFLEQSVCLDDHSVDISNVSDKIRNPLMNKKKRVHFSHRLNFVHELQLIDLRMKINPTKSTYMVDSELKSCLKNLQIPQTVYECSINPSKITENLMQDISDNNNSGLSTCNSCELFTPSPRHSPVLGKRNNRRNSDAVENNHMSVDGTNTSVLNINASESDMSIIVPPSTCAKRCESKIQATGFSSFRRKMTDSQSIVADQQTTYDNIKNMCGKDTKSLNFNRFPVRLKLIPVHRNLLNSSNLNNINHSTINSDSADRSLMCSTQKKLLTEINHEDPSFNNQSSPELFSQVFPLSKTSLIKVDKTICFPTLCAEVDTESSTPLSRNVRIVTSETFDNAKSKSIKSCSPMLNCSANSEDLFSPQSSRSSCGREPGTGDKYNQLASLEGITSKHFSKQTESPHLSNHSLCKKLFI